jgi:hypothetical protein
MSAPRTTFPMAEGVGIFVGVVAWHLLADGQIEAVRALLIAAGCSLVWFGLRCWKNKRGQALSRGKESDRSVAQ